MKPYYQDSAITIYHADCRDILPELPKVDLVLTDPPYGIGIENHGQVGRNRTSIVGDSDMEVGIDLLTWAEINNLPTIVFASPRKPWPGEWRNLIVWDKGGAVGGGGDLDTCLKLSWELIQVRKNKFINGSRDVSVWRYVVTQRDFEYHTCQKPIYIVSRLIDMFSLNADLILDPFMGSGTTLRAAKNLGRKAIGIEIEEKYCEIAAKRMAQTVMELNV